MSYKTKHLKKLLPYVATAIFTLSLSSCHNNKGNDNFEKNDTEQGLLSKKKIKTIDKYSTPVTLQSVNIPIYNSKGKRLKDCYILTKGQDASLFTDFDYGKTSLQRAYINDSPEEVYIMTGEHSEVIDESGNFIGLVIDDNGKPAIIAAGNMPRHVSEYKQENMPVQTYHSPKTVAGNDTIDYKLALQQSDSVLVDSAEISIDANAHLHQKADSIVQKHFIDSLVTKTL